MSKAIFFDLDGTLVDTSGDILASLSHAAREVGYRSAEFARNLIGLPVRSIFEQAIQGLSEDDLLALESSFRQHHDNQPMVHWKPYDGLDELLGFLHENALRYYVVTNRPRSGVVNLIRSGFSAIPEEQFFCLGELGSVSKGSLLGEVLRRECLSRESCLLFGDHAGDLSAGLSQAILSYYCSYGFGNLGYGQNSHYSSRTVSSLWDVIRKIRSFWGIL